jgi:hypothetical protein
MAKKTFKTVGDIRDERAFRDSREAAKGAAKAAAAKLREEKDAADRKAALASPRIGMLIRNGQQVFYIVELGQIIEGTVDSLLQRVGG